MSILAKAVLLSIFVMPNLVYAQDWICGPEQVRNEIGDIISWSWDIESTHSQDFCNFGYGMFWGNFEPVTVVVADNGADHNRNTWTWVAQQPNETMGLFLKHGCFHGWTCNQTVTVTHVAQPVNQPGDAIKRFIKDRAAQKSNDLNNAGDILQVLTPAIAALNFPAGLIAGAQVVFLYRQARHFDSVARDPCDPNDPNNCYYWEWYNPELADSCELGCWAGLDPFGDGRAVEKYNYGLDKGLQMDAYMGAAVERANRAMVCAQFGNDCFNWQRDGANEALRDAGYWAGQTAYWYRQTAEVYRQNGFYDAANAMDNAAAQLEDAAGVLAGAD